MSQNLIDSCNKIMIVGNLGYIGPVLSRYIQKKFNSTSLIGFDTGFFSGCLINQFEGDHSSLGYQIYEDVRNVREEHLRGVDHIVYLAAISNDPMGNIYEIPTYEINSSAAIRFAKLAKDNGVKSFVYASSCSVYGAGGEDAKNENSKLNPLTAYAKSKIDCEIGLKQFASHDFIVTCLRFATACGASPRIRLDLVLNDFVASAFLSNKIEILSDGTPWRPLIDVEEMCSAILWSIGRNDVSAPPYLAINIGFNDWNYSIKDLAYAVKRVMGSVDVKINSLAAPDKRSYRVDFSLYETLFPQSRSHKTIEQTISELIINIENSSFRNINFRDSYLIRLNVLNYLRNQGKLDQNLAWNNI